MSSNSLCAAWIAVLGTSSLACSDPPYDPTSTADGSTSAATSGSGATAGSSAAVGGGASSSAEGAGGGVTASTGYGAGASTGAGGTAANSTTATGAPTAASSSTGGPALRCSDAGFEACPFEHGGTLARDPSFGSCAGTSITGEPTVLGDGRVLIHAQPSTYTHRVTRLDALGNVDAAYGTAGSVEVNLAGVRSAVANGKVYLAGYTSAESRIRVARLTHDGSLDTGYGDKGIATASPPNYDITPIAMLVDAKERAVVAGWTFATERWGLYRLTAAGEVDTTFGTGGVIGPPEIESIVALAPAAGGGYVALGPIGGLDFWSYRISETGKVEQATKILDQQVNTVRDLAVTSTGKFALIFLYKPWFEPITYAVMQLLPDGTLDAGFGEGGLLKMPQANALAALPGGRLLIGGDRNVFRLEPTGSIDKTFGSAGVATVDVAPSDSINALVPYDGCSFLCAFDSGAAMRIVY